MNVLGLKPGESVPMERHGQMGMLYNPRVQLTAEEIGLLAEFYRHCEVEEIESLPSREALLEVVQQVGADAPPAAVEHVMAFLDEMHQASGGDRCR